MIIPMKQEVTAKVPVLDIDGNPVKDKYGKPKVKSETVEARVRYKSQLVTDRNGEQVQSSVEIDLPPMFVPVVGSEMEFTTIYGTSGRGTVIALEESVNLTGDKVYFRTVFI